MKARYSSLSLISAGLAWGCASSGNCPNVPATGATAVAAETSSAPAAVPAVPQDAPPATASAQPPAPAPVLSRLYVGSGDWGTATGAVTVYTYDPSSGAVSQTSRAQAGGLLSFLTSDSQHRFLYAADEEQKKLRSFAIAEADGSLTPVATTDMLAGPVFVNVSHRDAFVLAAEFNSGKTEVFALDAAGNFGARTAVVDSGKESHGVFLSADEKFAFVPGRGSDQVRVFRFDAQTGTLTPKTAAKLPKGSGCRHLDFHPNGKFMYLVNEFANAVVVFSYDSTSGSLKQLQSISTNPDEGVKSSAADIHVHPNGKFLYATNRPAGTNGSIVAYAIGDDGLLTFLEKESTEGQVPRNFHLVADATRIVVGNQESKSLISFIVDAQTGMLTKQSVTSLDVKPFFVSEF